MGRIKKTATERHEATISPFITNFIKQSLSLPLYELRGHIASFPRNWPFPRGDLYHWIPTLNRFDRILELFTTEYQLNVGPQTQPFELRLLLKGDAEDAAAPRHDVTKDEIAAQGFSEEGDRELVESILHFTRLLLEKCGNRSLYASSTYLNYLLNTVSLSLLKATLSLSLRLAQRYHTSRMRLASPHTLSALLVGHYNINLDKMQKMAAAFPKKTPASVLAASTPFKSKDKQAEDSKSVVNPSDIAALVKSSTVPPHFKHELSAVRLSYYDNKTTDSAESTESQAAHPLSGASGSSSGGAALPFPPVTPTPARRRSNLGPGSASASRTDRPSGSDEIADTPSKSIETPEAPIHPEGHVSTGLKTFELDSTELSGVPAWRIMQENLGKVPEQSHYDLLHRVRIAWAFNHSKAAVNDLVAVRILTIANLAYVYSDTTFQQRIGQLDSEEPRQTQLAQQLTEMLQPPSQGQDEAPKDVLVVVIWALEALSKSKSKSTDVTAALNVGVSHGVLFYILRKILATLAEDGATYEQHDWCKDLFDLVMALTQSSMGHQHRNAEQLVSAGFINILVDILALRTKQAEVYFPTALNFFDAFIHNGVRDAFQSLVNAKGLDVLADLIGHEVQYSLDAANKGDGLPAMYRTKITDYQIPFNQQQTLRQLLKFVAHMYHHNVGTNDRLLRNLIDSPQLLSALKSVISNAHIFGSNVWSGAMNILSSFIHNEPTSYQVIAEAGLSKAFLEAITQKSIAVSDISTQSGDDQPSSTAEPAAEVDMSTPAVEPKAPAQGILPVGETMRDIPMAYGAICLNENGMRMFQASDALEKFFEIFETAEHVKAMEEDADVPHYIGTAFDELVRHHPSLKERTANAVLNMVKKVISLCSERSKTRGVGSKLWLDSKDLDSLLVAGGRNALLGLSLGQLKEFQERQETDFFQALDPSTYSEITEGELESDELINGRTGGRSTSDFISVVCRFLQGFLANTNMGSAFIDNGGAELLLDMAMCPCNPYNFHELSTSEELSRILQTLVENKPHLVLPSLVRRIQLALHPLSPLIEHQRDKAYFETLTGPRDGKLNGNPVVEFNATYTVKHMVSVQILVGILTDILNVQNYFGNRHTPHTFLAQVNLTDLYAGLVDQLARLHSACVWEEIMMQNQIPEDWKEETRIKGMGFDNAEANNLMGVTANGSSSSAGNTNADGESSNKDSTDPKEQGIASAKAKSRQTAGFKNMQILTYLLSQTPTGIAHFLQALGKSLLPKHRTVHADVAYNKQNATILAEHLAEASVHQLKSNGPSGTQEINQLAYEIVVLSSIMQTLLDKRSGRSTSQPEVLTLVLMKFIQKGGFEELDARLKKYCELILQHKTTSDEVPPTDDVSSSQRIHALALAATNHILEFYAKVCQSKNIIDSPQSREMMNSHRDRADFFIPFQFVVETRHAVLPGATHIWDSPVMDALPTTGAKAVVDLLRLILEGEGEQQAVKRSENLKRRRVAEKKKWKPRQGDLDTLLGEGFDSAIVIQALFRCNNSLAPSREYCSMRKKFTGTGDISMPDFPIPEGELDEQARARLNASTQSRDRTTPLARVPSIEMRDADDVNERATHATTDNSTDDDLLADLGEGNQRRLPPDLATADVAQVLSQALAGGVGGDDLLRSLPVHRRTSDDGQRLPEVETPEPFVTIDDLEDKRKELRQSLIDRCLDVLNVHSGVTFELADLIVAASAKAQDAASTRSEIGETLVNSLMSLRPDEGAPVEGSKIASYAHLLALVMHQREFFEATLDTLKENFEYFAAFLKITPDQKPDESAPWISSMLAVMEPILGEDEHPQQIEWTTPSIDNPFKEQSVAVLRPPIVPYEAKAKVFDALVELLPKIGKDIALAKAVVRVLVFLTRRRPLAKKLGEKHPMQRMFSMMKQLAGIADENLQKGFIILLRHIIEDEETIRQVMRMEIQATFESGRTRPIDTTAYTRALAHLAVRNPELFVEVTNEKVQLVKWESGRGPQSLMLKRVEKPESQSEKSGTDAPAEGTAAPERPVVERTKTADLKPPVIESPDGVVQFLLKELSSYRDVEDKEQQASAVGEAASDENASTSTPDVDMSDSTPTPELDQSQRPVATAAPVKNDKPSFKADQHPIFVYRCFLLACLTELLASYNRTKIEFINFSRKAEHQASTPSKPRSGLLNYFLYNLIPVASLNHASGNDIPSMKRETTSFWAISVLVSLCAKTSEQTKASAPDTSTEEEPELVYVRKFVLEHALKSYRDAMSSFEPLDQKYARLLSLSELFNRMLTGKPSAGSNAWYLDILNASQKHLGRLMYEKNFIAALTASIAEIDLNFPNAKRAVKYILRPMKWLTDTGVTLSSSSDYSSGPTSNDEDEISSATSLSEDENEREETPDLFRNSTLGMFEPDREDEDDDEESEDGYGDVYGDEYDDEMDYEEDPTAHEGDVVSDDDEDDIDGMGPIEGLPGDVPMDLELTMNDDDVDDEDDSDLDEDDEDDSSDDDDDIEVIDEITGDDDNASMADDDEDGDEEEEEEEDWEDDGADDYDDHDQMGPHGGALDHMVRVLDGDEHSEIMDHLDSDDSGMTVDAGLNDQYFDDEMAGDEADEDEEDYDEEDIVYEPELEDENDAFGFGWDEGLPPGAVWRNPNPLIRDVHGNISMESDLFASSRNHNRSAGNSRGDDDGSNPLLQRRGGLGQGRSRQDPMGEWVYDGQGRFGRGPLGGTRDLSFVSDLIQMVGPQGARINIVDGSGTGLGLPAGLPPAVLHITGGAGNLRFPNIRSAFPSRFTSLFRNMGSRHDAPQTSNRLPNDPGDIVSFTPTLTHERWKDEARILFANTYIEKALKVVNSILKHLVPPAMEAKRQRDKAEAERKAAEQKEQEELRKKAEAERIEKEEREKKEREEREAREAEEAAERARERAERGETEQAASEGMEGVENQTDAEAAPAQPRVTTNVRGRELDITSLGIDREYLEALPEDMREEVIMQQFVEQRSHATEAGEQPSEISREFLEALPPDIQQELLRSEAADRRRRQRDANRRRPSGSGQEPAAAAQAGDMDTADFFATLPPELRHSVLMDADDEMLNSLPEEFQAEARAMMGNRRNAHAPRAAGEERTPRYGQAVIEPEPHRARRPVAQMLDKAGVATLLRLMFVSLHGSARSSMLGVLSDICKNSQNRAEVISILLSILQDGSADANALERSFAQLTVRAKQVSSQKTPQPAKRVTGQIAPPNTDISPLMIVQQCLAALTILAQDIPRVSSFFLSEHETSISQRVKTVKKGKNKESRASKYPLNALLTLLDRKTIIENSAVMERLASLLIYVTEPLKILLKRAKEAEKEREKKEQEAGQEADKPEDTGDVAMTGGEAGSDNKDTKTEKESEPEKKKHRDLAPPEVPEENLRLVVNIIAARECNSKTFQSTLEIINQLSAIPGAKNTFGKELVHRAKELAEAVLVDLRDLFPQIKDAKNATDVQGIALAKFSPPSADQTKLLRVLTALDYLFDPKHSGNHDRPGSSAAEALPQKTRDDLLSSLYETSTFTKLWASLSDCLAAIRERGNMNNVATILQPLIESFMVVCKNTTTKEQPLVASQELVVSTPPPEARIENLFFTFTEEHRKILNDLVRNNPKLLNGTFDVLAKNSKVLEFDNKRNYFTRRLHQRPEERISHPTVQLNIRRDQIFMDSFKNLYFKSANEIKHGKLNIRFHGEEGVDAGGVTREWFAALSRQMFNPDYALFNPVASDRTTFHPNTMSGINPEHLMFFKFIGRIIGKALYEGRVLDCHFSRAVYKRILGKSVSVKDMETLDLDYYKSLVWILENDITDITFETFSTEVDKFGEIEVIDLVPNGRNIPVTEENKHEYVRRVVEHRLVNSVKDQLDQFLVGFHEIIPAELVSIFNEQELELLISGLPDIDVDDWKNNTEYHNYQPTSPQIQWFWRAVRSFDKEEKAKLLQFVTGTSKVPLNGFKELEGMNGFSKFNIHRDFSSKDRLPSSHTCFNQIDLPGYESYEALRKALYTAITAGSEYFGFA